MLDYKKGTNVQDKYLNLPQEFTNLQRVFQSPNVPEFNRQLRVNFFLYHIQEEHPDAWSKLNLKIKFMTINTIMDLIRKNKLPNQYNQVQLLSEMQGFIDDFLTNGSKSQGFVDIFPLRLPAHPNFWKGYIDDISSTESMELFKKLVDDALQESYKQKAFKESVDLKNSLSKYHAKETKLK